jgi:formylglycine-generating enzyme required for sulfatase activity
LPTEVEWEAAARGLSGREYAHGGHFHRLCGNTLETHVRQTTPVGVFPEGDTPEGVADMTGNVAEWTSSLWGPDDDQPEFSYPYRAMDGREDASADPDVLRVLRGSGWNAYPNFGRAAFRFNDHPGNATYNLGLRLAVSR